LYNEVLSVNHEFTTFSDTYLYLSLTLDQTFLINHEFGRDAFLVSDKDVMRDRFTARLKRAVEILAQYGTGINPDEVEVVIIRGGDVEVYTKNYMVILYGNNVRVIPRMTRYSLEDKVIREALALPPIIDNIILNILKKAEGKCVPVKTIVEIMASYGVNSKMVEEALERLKREGMIFAPRHKCYISID